MLTEIVGYSAAVVGTSLMLPQVYKSYNTKKVHDLSFSMIILYVLNCTLWFIYGNLISAMPVIITNFIALIISIVLLSLKMSYR